MRPAPSSGPREERTNDWTICRSGGPGIAGHGPACRCQARYLSSLELWTLNEDAPLTGPCEDTDNSSAAWAAGSAQAMSTNNDVFHSETVDAAVIRGNSFGEQGAGTVVDRTGSTHRYSWGFRAVDGPQGGFRERSHTRLTP